MDGAFPGVSDDAEDALQTSSVQLENCADQLLDARLRDRVSDFVERAQEILDPLDQLFRSLRLSCHLGSQHIPVGVCWTFLTRPLPVYMCTPHGRHGSKERTARMMSIPLKFSGPFSSKIGVFCTASS